MITVPNQKIVRIEKEPCGKGNLYAAINLKALEAAAQNLDAGAFKLWIYFAKNQKEELIAEIGASALVNLAGLETAASFRNNAAYVQNWLQVLKSDKRFIVSASGKAEKAVALILGSAG